MEQRIRYIFSLIVNCVLFIMLMGIPSHAGTLRVGFFQLAPHAFTNEQNEVQGVAIDYFRNIAARMGVSEMTFAEFPLKRLLVLLKDEELDVVLALGKNTVFSKSSAAIYLESYETALEELQTHQSYDEALDTFLNNL